MKKTVYILSLLVLLLGGWAAALWLLPFTAYKGDDSETRYGINEGLELVEQNDGTNGKRYVVEDENGKELFVIPLRHCLLDTHYRNGQLRFREQDTHREGYIDRKGMVTFINQGDNNAIPENNKFVKTDSPLGAGADALAGDYKSPDRLADKQDFLADKQGANRLAESQVRTKVSADLQSAEQARMSPQAKMPNRAIATTHNNGKALSQVNLRAMSQSNPFYKEASKIMQDKLSETDAKRRHMIINYCEHFRTAYTTKDIDFLRQVFSDKALIIVGNVVKPIAKDDKFQAEPKVTYAIHSKRDYIARLSKVFAANKKIDVKFSGFRILRHPTMDGIYGVTLRQQYKSDRYSDDGYLFLLWDFRDKSMPLIHVRTWQPAKGISDSNDIISMQDFNLE